MKKYLIFLLLIIVSCQPDELMVVEPYPQYEMIFEESMSKVIDGQEFSFEVLTQGKHELIITDKDGSVIIPIAGLNTRHLYTKTLPKGELQLSLSDSSNVVKSTSIIVD
jgi:hypothetical protein